MNECFAIADARIFDGQTWHEDSALVVRGQEVEAILPPSALPPDLPVRKGGGVMLVPGFVDLQVNGGGGVMLNGNPDLPSVETICRAHAQFGTTALLPTLITDRPELTAAALAAGAEASRRNLPGFLGMHLEGPHLSVSRKGAHDPALFRPMTPADRASLQAARTTMPVLMTTVAPEAASPEDVLELTRGRVAVSLGHSDATYAEAKAAAQAGAAMVTHLFNAMSQIGSREPGLAGAALDLGALSAGLIADGIHVDPATIRIALRAKQGPGRVFLVTDAMATVGSDMTRFMLKDREIRRQDGRLTLADGTLAGADLDMISAVRFMHREIGVELGEALRMAALYPARAVGQSHRIGWLGPGSAADIVALSPALEVMNVWIGGKSVHAAS